MRKLTMDEKILIYFSRYKTGGSFTAKEYLNVMEEYRQCGALNSRIQEIKKNDNGGFRV